MQQPDDGLRGIFHTRLRQDCHWQAIETGGVGLGVPDSNVCIESLERWVEFKSTDAWAVVFRPEQISWHRKRIRTGGVTFIAVRRRHSGGPRKGPAVDELWLCSGRWAERLQEGGLQDREVEWCGVWSHGPSRWDWDTVRMHLVRGW